MSISFIDLAGYYKQYNVSVWKGESFYNSTPPYHSHMRYPEYYFSELSDVANPAYEGVRDCLYRLNLDRENYGSQHWNPMGNFIQPGNKVVIKPNFVLSSHANQGELFSIITHPSVIRAVVDYVYLALKGEGQIVIADAPQMDCDFEELLRMTRLDTIQEFYRQKLGFNVEIIDLRSFWLKSSPDKAGGAYSEQRYPLPGDPLGHVLLNLGAKSAFDKNHNWSKIYGADYNRQETIVHHHNGVHEYEISKTILSADVLISIPKLKVHKKVGVTLNAKGFVGINTNKNHLVHYTLGTPVEGGDQYPDYTLSRKEAFLVGGQRYMYDLLLSKQTKLLDWVYQIARKTYQQFIKSWFGSVAPEKLILDGGNWYGNDSAWRMVADLIRVAWFADKSGLLCDLPQRKIFSIVDGIIGGDNNGPLIPDMRSEGILIAGFHPLVVDLIGCRLMGFDWRRLKMLKNPIESDDPYIGIATPEQKLKIHSNIPDWENLFHDSTIANLHFEPHPGWKGHIELEY